MAKQIFLVADFKLSIVDRFLKLDVLPLFVLNRIATKQIGCIICVLFFYNNFLSFAVAQETSIPKLYWIEASGQRIKRADLDGSNVEIVVSNLGNAMSLAIDSENQKVYWCNNVIPNSISSINLDGSGTIESFPGTMISCERRLLIDNGKIYFGGINDLPTYNRSDITGTNVEELLFGDLGAVYGIANGFVYYHNEIPYMRNLLTGTRIALPLDPSGSLIDDAEVAKIYFGSDNLYRANYDTSDRREILSGSPWGSINHVAFEKTSRKLFWSAGDFIHSCNTDGSDVKILIEESPRDIAIFNPQQAPPLITSIPIINSTVGENYQYTVETDGFPIPTISLEAFPLGMNISGSTINWTPTTPGTVDVTIRASNGILPNALQSFTIEVMGLAPTIITQPLLLASVRESYTYNVDATGSQPLDYSLILAPTEMTINSTSGLIEWTPPQVGSFDVVVQASNSEGNDEQSFSITVASALTIPIITSTPVSNATVSIAYSYDVDASGNPAPSYTLVSPPAGMTIDATSGLVEWTPTQVGSVDVSVQATNPAGSDTQTYTLAVGAQLLAPVITSTPPTSGTAGESYQYAVQATGNPPPLFTLQSAPPGMQIGSSTGLITWTPGMVGQFEVRINATNSVGSTSQLYSILVSPNNSEPLTISTVARFGDFTKQQNYRLIGLPGGDTDIDVATTLDGTQGTDWNVFRDNGSDQNYFSPYESSGLFRFRPGRGFWVLAKEPLLVPTQVADGVTLDDGRHFTLNLGPGWNIIASPFGKNVPWQAVLDANASTIPSTSLLYGFDGAFTPRNAMLSYEAYYFFNSRAAGAPLLIPDPDRIASAKSSIPAFITLTLTLAGADSTTTSAYIVIADGAEDGLDPFDQPAPRTDFSALSLHVLLAVSPPLSLDARPSIDEGQTFELDAQGSAGTLTVSGLDGVAGQEVYLLDRSTTRLTDLRARSRITLDAGQGRYALLIGPASYIAQIRGETIPERFALLPAYPNPFSESTTIEYTMPEAGHVRVEVFDVLGRLVTTLVDTPMPAGLHHLDWPASGAAPGLYLVLLHAETGERDSKTVLITQ